MILQVMAAYDKKARAYLQPFYSSHADVALRSFRQAANQPGHQVCEHPEDFALFHLGTFSDDTAMFTLHQNPVHVAEAINLKKGAVDVQHEES